MVHELFCGIANHFGYNFNIETVQIGGIQSYPNKTTMDKH